MHITKECGREQVDLEYSTQIGIQDDLGELDSHRLSMKVWPCVSEPSWRSPSRLLERTPIWEQFSDVKGADSDASRKQ